MKRRIWKISEDRFDDKKPDIAVIPEKVESFGSEGRDITGSFTVSALNHVELKGFVYSDSPYVTVLNPSVSGTSIEIKYKTNDIDFRSEDTLEGSFDLILNMTEVKVPFKFTFTQPVLNSSVGEIDSLEKFGKLCEVNFNEALSLFHSKNFDVLKSKLNTDQRLLLRGYRNAVPSGINLEHYIEDSGLNEKLTFKLDSNSAEFHDIAGDEKGSFKIKRNTWGKISINIVVDSDFIDLSLPKINDEDFLGREYEYQYFIRHEKMHAGKNYARITVSDGQSVELFEVTAFKADEDLPVKKLYIERQKVVIRLMKYCLSWMGGTFDSKDLLSELFRGLVSVYKIDMSGKKSLYYDEYGIFHDRKDDISLSGKLSDAMDSLITYRLPVMSRLIISHAFIINNEAEKALNLIRDLKNDIRDQKSFEWAYLLYLCTLLNDDESYDKELTDEIENIFRQNEDDERIFFLILSVRKEYSIDPSRKLKDIRQWYNSGFNPPFFYASAWKIYCENPFLLNEIDQFVKSVLIFAKKYDLYNEELVSSIADSLHTLNEFDHVLFDTLIYFYEKEGNSALLEELIKFLIRLGVNDSSYSGILRDGIDRGLNIGGLYEAYLNSLPLDSTEDLPESVFLYFRFPSNISNERKAFLYVNLIQQKKDYPNIYKDYLPDMADFALNKMQEERLDDNLTVIYQEMMNANREFSAFSELVVPFFFIKRISVLRNETRQIILEQDLSSRPVVCPVKDHVAYVPVADRNYRIFLSDADGTVFADKNLYLEENVLSPDTAGRLPEASSSSVPAMIYNLTREQKGFSFSKNDIQYIKSIFNNNSFSLDFLIRIFDDLYKALSDQGEEDILLSYLWERRNEIGSEKISALLIGYAVKNQKYDEAYAYAMRCNASKTDRKTLVKLVDNIIIKNGFDPDDRLIILSDRLLSSGIYTVSIITYLERFFTGSLKDMVQIFKQGKKTGIYERGFASRIIFQMIYTDYHEEYPEDIYRAFLEEGGDKMLNTAFLTYWSRLYILSESEIKLSFFSELYSAVLLDADVNDSMRLAIMKFMINDREKSEEEFSLLDSLFRYYTSRNLYLPFFRAADESLKIRYGLYDKSFICLKYEGSKSLYVTVRKNGGPKVTLHLPEVYSGLYVRSFTLFTGDVIEYRIQVGKRDRIEIGKGSVSGPDYFEKTEEGRFDRINHMEYSMILNDFKDVKDTVRKYGELDIITKELFKIS